MIAVAKRCFDFVNAVILGKKGRVLLEKRSDVPVWALPGGERERGESPEAAVIREVKEETGLGIEVKSLVGRYRSSYLMYSDVTSVFLCRIVTGRLKANYESLELRFFPPDNLPKPLLFIYMDRISDAIAGRKGVDRVQKISLWRVINNLGFNPFLLIKLFTISFRKVFSL